jgi:hypothetical protein
MLLPARPRGAAPRATRRRRKGLTMEVEADVFSGRPNPRWALDEAETAVVAAMLGALKPAAQPAAAPDALGYRGIVLHDVEAAFPGCTRVRLHGGTATVECGGVVRHLADAGRRVEGWVMETARRRVDREVYQALKDSLSP